ncbi:Uncharacterised protein [uncultured archaeon]|nr:Uncharacterised protein [uncultured archaeon]
MAKELQLSAVPKNGAVMLPWLQNLKQKINNPQGQERIESISDFLADRKTTETPSQYLQSRLIAARVAINVFFLYHDKSLKELQAQSVVKEEL